MSTMPNRIRSRAFYAWRCLYTVWLLAWTVFFLVVRSLDWGSEVGYYNLYFGVLPAAVFLLIRCKATEILCWFTYGYDILLFLAFIAGLVWLPNYLGLAFIFPLAGFVFEGILLTALMLRPARLA